MDDKLENDISYEIRGAAFEVYNELGPGLFESVYEAAMIQELSDGMHVRSQVMVPVIYKGVDLNMGFKLDLLVDEKVIVELKSVEKLQPIHSKQLMTYLKLTGLKLGLLINFNEDPIKIVRIVNGL